VERGWILQRDNCRGTIVMCKDDFVVLLHFRFASAVVQYFLPGRMLDTSNSTRASAAQLIPSFQSGCSTQKRKIKSAVFVDRRLQRDRSSHCRHKCRPFLYPAATTYFSMIRLVWARFATPVCSFTVVRSTSRWNPLLT